MAREIGINSQAIIDEMKRRGPEILKELGGDIVKFLDRNKKKYFNKISNELESETNVSANSDSIDIRTNAIGYAYDTGNWDDPEVKADTRRRKESGYYRHYSAIRRRLAIKKAVHGKKRIPFITNAVRTGGKEMRKRLNLNAGK